MSDLRGYSLQLLATTTLVTETCYRCGVLFAMTEDFKAHRLRDRDNFHCPNGHPQHYTGESDTEKLRRAQARETALRDQLAAATRDAEQMRRDRLRERERIANGVCPCCRRNFDNVRRHMRAEHPEFALEKPDHEPLTFSCSCGREFETRAGLHTHQGRMRRDGWDQPGAPRWSQHLTEVPA